MASIFPTKLSFKDKAELFLYRDGTMTMARVLVGGVLGFLIGSGAGAATVGLVGAAMVGLTALAHKGIERAKKHVLTEFFREEIAASLGKEPSQVVQKDLEIMAKTPDQGGRGNYAIHAAVEDYRQVRNFFIGAQAVTAALMTGLLAALNVVYPGMPALAMVGVSSLLYNELFDTVRTAGEVVTDINKGTIVRDIRAITDQIGLGGRISSTRVFGVFVKANPELDKTIRKERGTDYEHLNINVKRELVRQYDDKYRIYQVTQDINNGAVNPTELAFAAFGQHSGVPRQTNALAPFKGLEESVHCAEEQGQVVCRGGSDASMVEDTTYDRPRIRDQVRGVEQDSSDIAPSTYRPRGLFSTEVERGKVLKDPFKALQ